MDALERADVDAVLALLVEDAAWSMPPMSTWYQGRDRVAAFLAEHALAVDWRHVPRIVDVTAFVTPSILPSFGLPEVLAS